MAYVYRYIDNLDGIIKYVGIVWSENRTLARRIYEHQIYDEWCKNGDFTIEYIEENINSRTDAEHFEAHYIALYETDKYYNVCKSGWGLSSFLPNRENDWKQYEYGDNKSDYIFRICWTEDEKFDVKMMPAIKRKCKKKADIWDRHCKCGCDNLFKKSIGKAGQMYCVDCGDWVCHGDREYNHYYTPKYNGRYEIDNGEIVTYDYYTICFGRKDCWKSYTKEELEKVSKSQPIGVFTAKSKLTWLHTYATDYDSIEDAKVRIINYLKEEKQSDISSVEEEIKEIKQKLKDLPKLLEASKNDYKRFLDKFDNILALES